MNRVWILTRSFPPHADISARRYAGLVPHLEALEWEPWILTLQQDSGLYGKVPGSLPLPLEESRILRLDQSKLSARPLAVKVFRKLLFKMRAYLRSIGFHAWVLSYLDDDFERCLDTSVLNLCRTRGLPKPDIILCSVGPGGSMVLGRNLARRLKVPYIVDFRDLRGLIDGRQTLLELFDRLVEGYLVSEASGFLATSPTSARLLERSYKKRAIAVFNGLTDSLKPSVSREASETPYLFYAGRLYEHQMAAVNLLISSVSAYNSTSEVKIKIRLRTIGPPDLEQQLDRKIAEYKAQAFAERLEGCPPEQVVTEANHAVANIVVEDLGKTEPFRRGTIPGKFMELLSLQPPVLVIARSDSDMGPLMAKINAGRHCSNETEVVDFLKTLPWREPPTRELGEFSRQCQAKKLSDFMLRILDGRPGQRRS